MSKHKIIKKNVLNDLLYMLKLRFSYYIYLYLKKNVSSSA